ncbi:MAG: hypothetical protein ABFQ62_04005 [Patescibacteria group bacterium]
MINNFKYIIFALVLLLILAMEQAWGLPSIFVSSSLFLAQNYKGYKQLVFLILTGLFLGIFYEFSLSLAVVVILFSQLMILSLASKIKSEGIRILLAIILISLVFLFKINFSFSSIFGVIYNLTVLVVIIATLFFLRRRRKTLSLSKRVV